LVQNIVLVWPGSKLLLKGCLHLRFALEFFDKVIHSISAQITIGFWLYYAYEVIIVAPVPQMVTHTIFEVESATSMSVLLERILARQQRLA
jgi:hypothetical protein